MIKLAAGLWGAVAFLCATALAAPTGPGVSSFAASDAVSPSSATVSGEGGQTSPAISPDEAGYWYSLPADFDAMVAEPDFNLQPFALLWKNRVRGNAVKGSKLRPAQWKTQTSDGRLIDLHTGFLSFDMGRIKGGSRDLTQSASVKLNLARVTMDAHISASAGKNDSSPDLWQKNRAEIEMKVDALPKTQVALTGADEFSQTYRSPGALGNNDNTAHLMQEEVRSAQLAATVSPIRNVQIEVGAAGQNQTTRDTNVRNRDDRVSTRIENQSEELFANVTWTPVPGLKLEAGERDRNFGIQWQGKDTKNGNYHIVEPHAAVTMHFVDAEVRTSIEHVTQGYNTDAFVAYASEATLKENVPIRPDHAWRVSSELKQKIGQAELTAAFSRSYNGTVTEFGFSGSGAQAPVSTPLRERKEVRVGLSLPLEELGLTNTSLGGDAVWRSSSVADPVTGKSRRASGEIPEQVSLRLEQRLPGENVRFGLSGQLSGSQIAFQTRQTTVVDASNTLGAYIAFKPGAYEFDLDVDGLVGTPQTTNYYYFGSRAVNQLPKSGVTPPVGPTVKFSLKRPF